MKISQALKIGKDKLLHSFREKDFYNPTLDCILILAHSLNKSKDFIYFNQDYNISDNEYELFIEFVSRRANFEPISYITNKKEFYGRDFYISNKVLIPRPETEFLIELFQKKVPKDKKFNFLEIGIGSGCLSVTILLEYINSICTGIDISNDAIINTKKNINNYSLQERSSIFFGNILENFSGKFATKFDYIISNPPYITTKEIEFLQEDVKLFEPKLALDGGENGLVFYEEIAKNASNYLNEDGLIFLEIGINQLKLVEKIFSSYNLLDVKKDIQGIDRILCFEKK